MPAWRWVWLFKSVIEVGSHAVAGVQSCISNAEYRERKISWVVDGTKLQLYIERINYKRFSCYLASGQYDSCPLLLCKDTIVYLFDVS